MINRERKNYPEVEEDEILLLHQLEQTICNIIEKEHQATRNDLLVCAWKILINLMPEYKSFQALGIKPYLARGLLAEIMARYVFTEWAKSRNIKYQFKSNLLIPRGDKGTTQLDCVFITKRFSAVIECKSFYGKISIQDGVVRSATKSVEPWRQNYGHIVSLKKLLGNRLQMYFHNILYIFSEGVISSYEPFPDEHLVVNRVAFSVLDDIYDNGSETVDISDSDFETISSILDAYIPTVEEEVQHIDFIQSLIN